VSTSGLDGRVALVTGGARGQGRAHARALAAAGATVVVSDIAAQIPTVGYPMPAASDLEETVEDIRRSGGNASFAVLDVRSSSDVDALVKAVVSQHGRIDILIANAGICGFSPVAEISDDVWQDMIATNLTGVFHCIRAVLPHMTAAHYGRIVATSSGAGRSGMRNLGHYGASKWGLIGLVKTVALEAAPFGVTANVVCPTSVATPMVLNDATFGVFCPDIEQPTIDDVRPRFEALSPMGIPWLEPEDVSRAVLYLVTDPGYTSGTVIEVNLATSASRT
jgi:SDR family mycofactocin-dependent oxidoreductase